MKVIKKIAIKYQKKNHLLINSLCNLKNFSSYNENYTNIYLCVDPTSNGKKIFIIIASFFIIFFNFYLIIKEAILIKDQEIPQIKIIHTLEKWEFQFIDSKTMIDSLFWEQVKENTKQVMFFFFEHL